MIDEATIAAHGLTPDEYQRVLDILGREPNMTELGIFSVMWSEHCSYKSSRKHLAKLPTDGPRVLQGPGENAGAIDLSMDPNNPRILYASIFQFLRQPWDEISGGPDSGLYKSTDGGDTWTEISENPGLPRGVKGRIGVVVSPARPGRVWAKSANSGS